MLCKVAAAAATTCKAHPSRPIINNHISSNNISNRINSSTSNPINSRTSSNNNTCNSIRKASIISNSQIIMQVNMVTKEITSKAGVVEGVVGAVGIDNELGNLKERLSI